MVRLGGDCRSLASELWPHALCGLGTSLTLAARDAPAAMHAVPVALLLLSLVERVVLRSGRGRGLSSWLDSSAWIALVLASLIGDSHELLLACGVVLLLLRMLAAARAVYDGSETTSRWLFVPFFVGYAALAPFVAHNHRLEGDEPYYLLMAQSLLRDGDVDLANNYANKDSLEFHDRALEPQHQDPDQGRRSRHPALLALLVLPGFALAGRLGAMWVMAALGAVPRLRRHRHGARPSGRYGAGHRRRGRDPRRDLHRKCGRFQPPRSQ